MVSHLQNQEGWFSHRGIHREIHCTWSCHCQGLAFLHGGGSFDTSIVAHGHIYAVGAHGKIANCQSSLGAGVADSCQGNLIALICGIVHLYGDRSQIRDLGEVGCDMHDIVLHHGLRHDLADYGYLTAARLDGAGGRVIIGLTLVHTNGFIFQRYHQLRLLRNRCPREGDLLFGERTQV